MDEHPNPTDAPDGGEGRAIPQGRLRRSLPLAGFSARTAGEAVVASLARGPRRRENFERLHERTAERYVEAYRDLIDREATRG